MKIAGVLAAVAAAAVLAGCGSDGDQPGNQAVYDRIAGTSDCETLQHEFDTASASHDRASTDDQREIALSYMRAADDRMKEVSCY